MSEDITEGGASDEGRERFVSDALERARAQAHRRGYHRTSLPSLRSAKGLSEDFSDAPEDSPSPNSDAAPAAPSRGLEGDTEGDLLDLSQRLSGVGSGWMTSPGLAAHRPRYRDMRTLGGALTSLIHRNGWDGPTRMGSVLSRWTAIVGPDIANHCSIETFEGGTLIVRTTSTAWAKQLTLLLPTIERRVAEEVGTGVVTQVIVRGPVAPSWKKGRLSVPGRGPRDTYG
ncbi:MAG: DciA family protein [Actinomycetaceae bacterium]|nr:DciA family protein [Actinomycetaceae bacterium]